ncbi:phosphatase PAP2 family protein [Pseudomonas sp. Marseille-QA0892]
MAFWHFVTNLGDSAIMLPCAMLMGIWLLLTVSWQQAVRWYLCFAAASLLVAASKIAFFGWGVGIRALDFTGFSGHSMLGAAVMPVLGWLLFQPSERLSRAGAALGAVLAIMVAWSRVHLGYHSPWEAVTGSLIGLSASAYYLYRGPRVSQKSMQRLAMAAVLLAPIVLFHGVHAPTHGILQRIGAYIAGNSEPFSRQDLRKNNSVPRADSLAKRDQAA